MKIVKLKLCCEKLRALSDFYGLALQLVARKAEISWRRSGRESFAGIFPTGQIEPIDPDKKVEKTVLDVTDEYTLDQWREMIHTYVDREFNNIPAIHADFIKAELIKAEQKKAEANVNLDSSSDSAGNSYHDVQRSISRRK